MLPALEHDPEKWVPVFGKRSCSSKRIERDDDSKKSHPALSAAMIDFLIATMSDTRFLAMMFAAIAAAATVITLAMPLFVGDNLGRRMKAVALEREKIRQRERERLIAGQKVSLRRSPKQYMKTVVERFNLAEWV